MKYVTIPKDHAVAGTIEATGKPFDLTLKFIPWFLAGPMSDAAWFADEAGPPMALEIIERAKKLSGPGDVLELSNAEQERVSKAARQPSKGYAEGFAQHVMSFVAAICTAKNDRPEPAKPAAEGAAAA